MLNLADHGFVLNLNAIHYASINAPGNVASVRNIIGNGLDFVQSNANARPVYTQNAFNSRPAFRFGNNAAAGDVKRLLTIADNSLLNYTAFDAWVVGSRADNNTAAQALFGKFTATGDQREFNMTINNNQITGSAYGDGGTATGATAYIEQTIGAESPFLAHLWFENGWLNVRRINAPLSGAAVGAWYHARIAIDAIFNGTGQIVVGAFSTAANPFEGFIGEVALKLGATTQRTRDMFTRHFLHQWGIEALP